MMKKTFETTLPEGYEAVLTVDAKNKKTAVALNAGALAITFAGILAAVILFCPSFEAIFTWKYFAALAFLLFYIVLHELTHGAAYKLLTGRKLTFGLTLTVAYCGVPDILVYRKTALISLLAPFVVFDLVFLGGALLFPLAIDRFYAAVLLAFHVGGCVGDLYDTWLFMTGLRDPSILMQDTGPKQIFYKKTTR